MLRESRVRRWLPLVAVAGLLVAAWLAATLSSPGVTQVPLEWEGGQEASAGYASGFPPTPPAMGQGQAASNEGLPEWVPMIVGIVCGLIAVVLVGVLLSMVLRTWVSNERPLRVDAATPTPMSEADEVAAALDAGLVQLSDADADARRAVIACWVRLEGAAARAGTPRQPGDSPADLVHRLLAGHRISRPVLDRFAAVYREARYATHPVDEYMRQTALSALRQLRGELAAGMVDAGGTSA